jgi:multidrug efflux pump subunit AcrA (membrane-fusion protein)
MRTKISLLRKVASSLYNVVILAALAGLAYWGHANHWHVPGWDGGRSQSGDGVGASGQRVDDDPAEATSEYPVIRFDSTAAVKLAGIDTIPVKQECLKVFVEANAAVGYDQTRIAELSSRVAGFVWSVHGKQGQFVRKGTLLALVDCQDVGKARAEYLQEVATSLHKLRRLERLRELAGRGAVSDATLREAEAESFEARVRRFNARQRLSNLGLDFDPERLEENDPEELRRHLNALGLPPEAKELFKDGPRTANLLPLVAPHDGVITRFDLVVGEWVAPEHPQIIVADVRTCWFRVGVRQEDVHHLAVGQSVYFTKAGQRLEGKLAWIGTAVDEKTRTVEARAVFANPLLKGKQRADEANPRVLRVNEFGTVRILVDELDGALLVPRDAVQLLEDDALVFVAQADGKTFQPRKVEVAPGRDNMVRLCSGVCCDDRVARSNTFVLKSELMKDSLQGGD